MSAGRRWGGSTAADLETAVSVPPTHTRPPAVLWHPDYDHIIRQPREAGRDPVWDSLLAQALTEAGAQ